MALVTTDADVAADTPVVASAGGAAIAHLPAGSVALDPAAAPSGDVRIVHARHGVTVRGLVAAAAVTRREPATVMSIGHISVGGAGALTDIPFATLRAGASFYDHPDGDVVGRTTHAITI